MLYNYQARTHEGLTRSGSVEAPSVDAAIQMLQRQNLFVLQLESAVKRFPWYQLPLARFHGVGQKEVMLLARQLSTLFEAKVPVVQTFRTLIGQSGSRGLQQHLTEVLDDVQGGMSMSQAMGKHPTCSYPPEHHRALPSGA